MTAADEPSDGVAVLTGSDAFDERRAHHHVATAATTVADYLVAETGPDFRSDRLFADEMRLTGRHVQRHSMRLAERVGV